MDVYERTTCSFIVKIWLEELSSKTGRPSWRGHITHVPSGSRKYFEDLNEIILFINFYLQALGHDERSTPE
ncbi:MAG: hypothetical protein DCC55_03225 [Chloroflexi bacterium]|nr:MAG: hypothetical protein DCC55_03225 [Chloroflexota bacterium]